MSVVGGIPGDIAHSGLVSELTSFAAVWYKVLVDRRRLYYLTTGSGVFTSKLELE